MKPTLAAELGAQKVLRSFPAQTKLRQKNQEAVSQYF